MRVHGSKQLDNADVALRNLLECLVLSYRYVAGKNALTFVCDYPYKSTGSAREFAAFVFHEVSGFSREPGNLEPLRRFREEYDARDDPGAVVIQAMRFDDTPNGNKRMKFWLGPNFGGISFDYSRVDGFTRASTVEEVDGTFLYRDLRTKEEFDFLAPFAGMLEDK